MSEETSVEEIELSKEAKGVIDTVEKMTVLELSQLVKVLEDKFGVVAAAPVAFAGAPAAAGGDDDEGTGCLLYTSPSPRDGLLSRMPSSA